MMSIAAPKMFLIVSCEAKPTAKPPVARSARKDLEVSGSTMETALTEPTRMTTILITVESMGTSTSSNLLSVSSATFLAQAIGMATM